MDAAAGELVLRVRVRPRGTLGEEDGRGRRRVPCSSEPGT
ncbi:hypothetical protein [Streptomyces sp. NPDC002463]